MVTARSNTGLPPPPQAQQVLQQMANGRVQAARRQLVRIASEGLCRGRLVAGPNYLGTIPSADAAADVEEATRWYQTWHTVAVKEGLVADSISLERIIRSMRQPPTR